LQTLVFCSFKGGTGKTTLSLNVGCNLAQFLGKRVLLIDLDPQSNLSSGLGASIEGNHKGLHEVMCASNDLKSIICKTKKTGVDIIPASFLSEQFREFSTNGIPSSNLRLFLDEYCSPLYDVCIVDTPPSLGGLTKEAFIAGDKLIVCLIPEPFSILGLQKIREFLISIGKPEEEHILGVALSFWDDRSSTNQTYIDIIESIYENKIFSTKIRRDISLSRSLLKEDSVINVYPTSRAATDILNLTHEISALLNSKHKQDFSQRTL
jgi:ATPases involved in chromosome partitioning